MMAALDKVTLRLDTENIKDTLGTLAQAFQDSADALFMARDHLDEALATAEHEGDETP
jgi:hypothetical protein